MIAEANHVTHSTKLEMRVSRRQSVSVIDPSPLESPLDRPEYAAYAWARYRRLMKWMGLVSVLSVTGALVFLASGNGGELTLAMVLATVGGVGGSVLLMAALMGLVFLSSGTGHDETIDDPFKDLHPDD